MFQYRNFRSIYSMRVYEPIPIHLKKIEIVLFFPLNLHSAYARNSLRLFCSFRSVHTPYFHKWFFYYYRRRVPLKDTIIVYLRKKEWFFKNTWSFFLLPQATAIPCDSILGWFSFRFTFLLLFSATVEFNFFGAPACEPSFFSAHNIFYFHWIWMHRE